MMNKFDLLESKLVVMNQNTPISYFMREYDMFSCI